MSCSSSSTFNDFHTQLFCKIETYLKLRLTL